MSAFLSELTNRESDAGGEGQLTGIGTADELSDVRFVNRVLDLAVRVGGVGVWEWDAASRRMSWNAEARRLLGVGDHTEASWERWIAAVHPDDREAARAAARRAYADGEARLRVVRPDGTVRHVLVRGETLRDRGRDVVVGVGIDVTEVTWTQLKMARILEAMSDGCLVVDRHWRVTTINSHAENLMGRPAGTLVGEVVWNQFPALSGTAVEQAARRVFETGQPEVIEEGIGLRDTWFEVRMHASGDNLVVYFRDICLRRAR